MESFILLTFFSFIFSCTTDRDIFIDIVENQKADEEFLENDNNEKTGSSNKNSNNTKLKAFEGAFGAGAVETTGGRGGKVILVTNLNDSGEGSLRNALNQKFPRTIIFHVSGVINLKSRIILEGKEYGNITLAGQSAPKGGITITGGRLWWSDSENIIIRFIKFRNGNQSDNGDCLTIERTSRVMVDHCSFSYATDEALDVSGNSNPPNDHITLQNNLFGECKTAMIVGANNKKEYGSVSILRNATANVGWRYPKAGGALKLDVINNVHHNWRHRTINMEGYSFTLNHINNIYQGGYNTGNSLGSSPTNIHTMWTNPEMSPSIYTNGNIIPNNISPEGYEDNQSLAWSKFSKSTLNPKNEWFIDTPHLQNGEEIEILSTYELFDYIDENVGSFLSFNDDGNPIRNRDLMDKAYIDLILSQSPTEVLMEKDYGKIPEEILNTSYSRGLDFDKDNDGMSDIWELKVFGQLDENSNQDFDKDGYTNIEEYLNQVDNFE